MREEGEASIAPNGVSGETAIEERDKKGMVVDGWDDEDDVDGLDVVCWCDS